MTAPNCPGSLARAAAARLVVADAVGLPLGTMSRGDTDGAQLRRYAEREATRIARLPERLRQRDTIGLLAITVAGSAAERLLCGAPSVATLAAEIAVSSLVASILFDKDEPVDLRDAEFFAYRDAEAIVAEHRLIIRTLADGPECGRAAARALLEANP